MTKKPYPAFPLAPHPRGCWGKRYPDENPDIDTSSPPPELIERIRWWNDFTPSGNLTGSDCQHPPPLTIPTTAAAARRISQHRLDNAFNASPRLSPVQVHAGSPLTGPIRVDAEFIFPPTKAQIWRSRPMPRIPHANKPDRDNLAKACLDALKGRMWIGDAQICDGRIEKWVAAGDEQPHVLITVTAIGDEK